MASNRKRKKILKSVLKKYLMVKGDRKPDAKKKADIIVSNTLKVEKFGY